MIDRSGALVKFYVSIGSFFLLKRQHSFPTEVSADGGQGLAEPCPALLVVSRAES
jgi:hypothetical protein